MDFGTALQTVLENWNRSPRASVDTTSPHYQKASKALIKTLKMLRSETFVWNVKSVRLETIYNSYGQVYSVDEFPALAPPGDSDYDEMYRVRDIQSVSVAAPVVAGTSRTLTPLKRLTHDEINREIQKLETGTPRYFGWIPGDATFTSDVPAKGKLAWSPTWSTDDSYGFIVNYTVEYMPPTYRFNTATTAFIYARPTQGPGNDFAMTDGDPSAWKSPLVREGLEMVVAFTVGSLYRGPEGDIELANNWTEEAESMRSQHLSEYEALYGTGDIEPWL